MKFEEYVWQPATESVNERFVLPKETRQINLPSTAPVVIDSVMARSHGNSVLRFSVES
jgi:hypothetical protein